MKIFRESSIIILYTDNSTITKVQVYGLKNDGNIYNSKLSIAKVFLLTK